MEDRKPDKAVLDQSVQDWQDTNWLSELADTVRSGNEPVSTGTVSVKLEPPDDVPGSKTIEAGNIATTSPTFSSDLASKYEEIATASALAGPSLDIAGPSSSHAIPKLEGNESNMNASQMLRAMAGQTERLPGPSGTIKIEPRPSSTIEIEPRPMSSIEVDPRQATRSLFHIDTSQIQGAATADQSNDLAGLGVSVYNQEEFEASVMQQVDQAINLEEEKAAKQRAEKDLNAVLTDIRLCKQEVSRMDKLINAVRLPARQNYGMKDAHRKMLSIQKQRDNKVKQLKNLRARHRTLLAKLSGSAEGLDLSDEEDTNAEPTECDANILKGLLQGGATMSTQETEQERMIRLGEMTPFGTTMGFAETNRKAAVHQKKAVKQEMTDFEKAMLEKDDLAMEKPKKILAARKLVKKRRLEREQQALLKKKEVTKKKNSILNKPSKKSKSKKSKTSTSTKDTSENTFKDGTYFSYKPTRSESSEFPRRTKKRSMDSSEDLRPNWGSDVEMSDYDNGDDVNDSDEYVPSEAMIADESADNYSSDGGGKVTAGRVTGRGKKRKICDDIEDGVITSLDDLKRAHGAKKKTPKNYNFIPKAKDDSSQDQFYKRLRANKKKRLLLKQQKIEKGDIGSESDEEDMEFEGGLMIPGKIWDRLFRYQKTGVKWLWELHQQQCGGIVGDEMGLGKTIQMIAFLAGLRQSKLRSRGTRYTGLGPSLIVCPTTVMHQWVKEFHIWAPDFRVAILHASGSHTGSRATLVKDIAISHAVLITSYSSVRLRQDILLRYDWHYVILDEGHKIRNPDAHVTLACKQFRTPHRIILSGSPMQNNLRELWSLFDFVFPGKLGTLPVFMEKFSVPITLGGYSNASSVQVQTSYKCACVLRDTINPYLLRRMKDDVKAVLKLPEKNEQVLFCRLTDEQTDLYKEYLNSKECQMILNREYQIFAGLITLRKISNHPDLVSGGPRLRIGESADDPDLPEDLKYGYWKRSGKMVVVESLLKLWKQQDHKVLLFSQSKQMLDIFEFFVKKKYKFMRMDGGTPISSRQTLINRFNHDPSIFLFLLTTRVGGLGVNLTGANRVVIYDPDWNPSTDLQARERSWRIGQSKQVTIYRLLTSGTIEEKIYHRQIFKTFLSNRVLKDPRQRRFFKSNDLFELFSLGSSSNTHGTETSAIFAGTGSDVRVKMPNVKRTSANLAKLPSLSRTKSRSDFTKTDNDVKRSKVKRSSSTPKKLSEHGNDEELQLVDENTKRDDSDLPKNGKSAIKNTKDIITKSMPDSNSAQIDSQSQNMSEFDDKERTNDSHTASPSSKSSSAAIRSSDVKASLAERARQLARQMFSKPKEDNATHHQSPIKKSGLGKESDKHGAARTGETSHSKTSPSETRGTVPNGGAKKKKRKKKKKGAMLDGHRITNLAKSSDYRPVGQETDASDQKEKNAQMDDYVLGKLFQKSGVHSALQHDNIMNSCNPDYLLVENEADRVAKEAVRALKQSRQRCMTAASGVPTWTGASGRSGAPPGLKKPRFGQKSNSRISGLRKQLSSAAAGKPSLPKVGRFGNAKKNQHFQGDTENKPSSRSSSSQALPASNDLLAKMRARNHIILDIENDENGDGPGFAPNSEQGNDELMKDIHTFVAFQGAVDGQATTDELLKQFQSRLPKNSTAVFKAMLTKICTFYRNSSGEGVWKLKPDFR